MMGELRRICLAHKLGTGRNDEQLFLGRSLVDPFYPSTVGARAHKAWKAAKLEPLTPHEARHRAASYMIACGLDWKKISEFLGHTDARTTFNRYGKVVDEDLSNAAARLEAYFDRHRDSSQAGNLLGNLVNRFGAVPSGSQRAKRPTESLGITVRSWTCYPIRIPVAVLAKASCKTAVFGKRSVPGASGGQGGERVAAVVGDE